MFFMLSERGGFRALRGAGRVAPVGAGTVALESAGTGGYSFCPRKKNQKAVPRGEPQVLPLGIPFP